jgi:hypothetical protein
VEEHLKTKKLNDAERSVWVDNDEGLHIWQRRSGLSMRGFIRRYREEIDVVIRNVEGGQKPAHYLAYGG